MMLATSITTRQKAEASVTEASTVDLPVVDTSESVRYKVFLEKFHRLVEAVRPVVVKFAVNALSKSLISEYNKCQAENPTVQEYDRASVLMSQILPKIKDSGAHFDAFVSILQDVNITKLAHELKKAAVPTVDLPTTASRIRGDSDSGSTSGAELVHVDATGFKCPCGQCSLEKYFRERSKCPRLQETAFPFLDTSRLRRDERETLEHQLIGDTNRIRGEFKKLSDVVFKALERNETTVSKIKSTVFSSAEAGHSKPIQKLHGDELKTITNLSDLKSFLIRHKYISFINHGVLEDIVDEHCNECRTDLDSYLQKLSNFCRRNVFEVPSYIFDSYSTSTNLLVVKVIDEIWFGAERETYEHGTHDCTFTMNDIKSMQNKIGDVIGHNRHFIHLLDVGSGCIQLSFAIFPCQDASIFPFTTSQLSKLINHGIIVLYQPKVPSLPTNVQDIDNPTHAVPSADVGECKSPPILSTNSETTHIPLVFKTPRNRSTGFNDDESTCKTPRKLHEGQYQYQTSIGKTSSASRYYSLGSTSSSSELPQQKTRRYIYKLQGFPIKRKTLESRITDKKRDIEFWRAQKAVYQQMQSKLEEEVRCLMSVLAQTSDPHDRKRLGGGGDIQYKEEAIKVWKESVKQREKWINKDESDLQALIEVKDKGPMTIYQPVTGAAVKPTVQYTSSELDQSNFNYRLVSGALINLLDWHKLGLMLGLKKINLDQIRVDSYEYGIKCQRDEMVSLWLHSDGGASWEKLCTALENMDQNTIANQIRISKGLDSVTHPIPSVTTITFSQFSDDDGKSQCSMYTRVGETSSDSGYSGSMSSYSAHTDHNFGLQEPGMNPKSHMHEELSLTTEQLERRIEAKKSYIEYLKREKVGLQQQQWKAEEEVRLLQIESSRTARRGFLWSRLERDIQMSKKGIKIWQERVQRHGEIINHIESELQVLEERIKDFNYRLVSMALTNLLDWHKLGLMLGLKKINLDQIRVDFISYGIDRRRDEMVLLWLRNDRGASWEKLCTALENMDQNTIVDQIRTRYK